MLTLTNLLSRLVKPIFLAALSVSFFIVGCGSPYLEKGFKSEEDYNFAQSVNLSPHGVDLFKSARVVNVEQYRAALNEMHITKYSNSDDANDVWRYVQDRFQGERSGLSAIQQRDARNAEAAKKEAQRREAERLAAAQRAEDERRAAKKRADEEAAAAAAKTAAKQESERKRSESEKYLEARLEGLEKQDVDVTDVFQLIVNFKSYEGKKLFLSCSINLVDANGGFCWSDDGKQYITFKSEGINKRNFSWLLKNCPYKNSDQNHDKCQNVPIIGTGEVYGSKLRLKNVYFYELCTKRLDWQSVYDCYVEDD